MHVRNRHADRQGEYACQSIISLKAAADAKREIAVWPGYRPTPLVDLPALARRIGIGAVWYKDEAERFGLGSFKALGGAYAVRRLLASELGDGNPIAIGTADLLAGRYADRAAAITICCATDGNHGRAVAWAAQLFGCRAVIYLHETVSEGRERAIAAFGAEIVRRPGTYDDAVRHAAADARANGWHVVSDTAYPGYVEIPRDVMQGYTVLVEEALGALPHGVVPSHVFVQAGVGGFAAAVCAHLWERWGSTRPCFVVVEPEAAPCIFDSIEAGEITAAEGDLNTVMAGLACGEPSTIGWEILSTGADHALTISDAAAMECMRLLARGGGNGNRLVAGESGVAGLAGLLYAAGDPEIRRELGLAPSSGVLVFGTEGATDPALYHAIVGRMPEAVQ